jgi:hypothetical protein
MRGRFSPASVVRSFLRDPALHGRIGAGYSAPTSPRREASLLTCPVGSPAGLFLWEFSKVARYLATPRHAEVQCHAMVTGEILIECCMRNTQID